MSEFSEPIGIGRGRGPPVSEGAISWDGNILVFAPSSGLERGRSYAVTVSASDLAGNTVTAEWTFSLSEVAPVKGLVKDAAGKPVAGATVSLSTGDTAITDTEGTFTFKVEPGTYDATVSKDGYQVAMVTVRLGPEQVAVVGLSKGSAPTDYILPVAGVVLFGAALLVVSLTLSRKRR